MISAQKNLMRYLTHHFHIKAKSPVHFILTAYQDLNLPHYKGLITTSGP